MPPTQAKRLVSSVQPDGNKATTPQVIYPDLRVLVEGLKNEARNSTIGRIEGAAYTFSWCDAELRDGDIIVWKGRQFHLRGILDDTTRGRNAFYTGILAGKSS